MSKVINFIFFFLLVSDVFSQVRAFDNSKEILQNIYNPAATISGNSSVYAGYDARGTSNYTPQSVLLGFRYALKNKDVDSLKSNQSMIGMQAMNSNQFLFNNLKLNLSFAHQISIAKSLKLGAGLGVGISNSNYNQSKLSYLDQDQLLLQGNNYYNMFLQAGLSLISADKFYINLAAPDVIKNGDMNVRELIVRAAYYIPTHGKFNLLVAGNLDTYNRDFIYGGDLKLEYMKTFSVLTGVDNYKYFGGLMLNFKQTKFAYTYAVSIQNKFPVKDAHQITFSLNLN